MPGSAEGDVLRKLRRWIPWLHACPDSPRQRERLYARRFLDNLSRLQRLVPPCVVAAVWSIMWNRLMTERRCQQRNARCLLCDNLHALDSAEHIHYCPALAPVHTYLQLPHALTHPRHSLLLVSDAWPDDILARLALRSYAIYNAHNTFRNNPHLHHTPVIHFVRRSVQRLASRDRNLSRILDGRF